MGFYEIITTIVLVAIAYYTFWYRATDKLRFTVYEKQLRAYQILNKLVSDNYQLCMKAEIDPEKYNRDLAHARIAISDFIMSNSLLISNEVSNLTEPFRNMQQKDIESLRNAFNAFTGKMYSELLIEEIIKSNKRLLKPSFARLLEPSLKSYMDDLKQIIGKKEV